MRDWPIRFIKGMFIGTGFILPGVSGGALAAIFGIYERIIVFLAHITRDFKKNVLYFIPIGLGALTGIFLLSFAVSFFLDEYEAYTLWFFIGCILGTLPALWKQAGKKGRSKRHYIILGISFAAATVFLFGNKALLTGGVPQSFGIWILSGVLIALGMLVPGLSPSNFLIYMDLYKPMTDAIKSLDVMVILPVGIGLVACVLLLSKLLDVILKRAYAGLFHCILGTVFASTLVIIPLDFDYAGLGTLFCLMLCAAGALLGHWMSFLEKKYKPDV